MKAPTKAMCRAVRIFNEHNYSQENVYIFYRAGENGRITISAAWGIRDPRKSLSDRWHDYNCKYFTTNGVKSRPAILAKALAWVTERYGIIQFAKTPFGSWMEKSFVEKRNAEILAEFEKTLIS
jgi:hypothetical protein